MVPLKASGRRMSIGEGLPWDKCCCWAYTTDHLTWSHGGHWGLEKSGWGERGRLQPAQHEREWETVR